MNDTCVNGKFKGNFELFSKQLNRCKPVKDHVKINAWINLGYFY